jgi:hypothetical protein
LAISDPHTDTQLPTPITPTERLLASAEFHRLAEVPPEIEWFANLSNAYTRRAYENAIKDFMRSTGIVRCKEFPNVTRAHVRHVTCSPRPGDETVKEKRDRGISTLFFTRYGARSGANSIASN